MRRLTFIFGTLLALTAGVWGSALTATAAEWCLHEARAPVAVDEHGCCRARFDGLNSNHPELTGDAHEAMGEKSLSLIQVAGEHAGMDCAEMEESAPPVKVAAIGGREVSCAECCASSPGQTPATATVIAPEQSKVKRDTGDASVSAPYLSVPAILDHLRLAPSQHAPLLTEQRRHILNGIFLI